MLMLFGIELVGTLENIVVSSATNNSVKNRYPSFSLPFR